MENLTGGAPSLCKDSYFSGTPGNVSDQEHHMQDKQTAARELQGRWHMSETDAISMNICLLCVENGLQMETCQKT